MFDMIVETQELKVLDKDFITYINSVFVPSLKGKERENYCEDCFPKYCNDNSVSFKGDWVMLSDVAKCSGCQKYNDLVNERIYSEIRTYIIDKMGDLFYDKFHKVLGGIKVICR